MEIKVLRTTELTDVYWDSFIRNFNQVFDKNYEIEYFKQKYLKTLKGFSYHSFLIHESEVVGACSIIPYEYIKDKENCLFGLAVDVFISPEFREDPLALFRMYSKLKKLLKEDSLVHVMAVPNDVAYTYWKSIVKWKDVGQIPYFVLPVQLGNILKKWRFSNPISRFITKGFVGVNQFFSVFYNPHEKLKPIRINRYISVIEDQRYNEVHQLVRTSKNTFSYRIVVEDGVRVAYLIDFYNSSKLRDYRSLLKALSFLLKHENVDLILFVGQIFFRQFTMFRVPKSKEPKVLYFTGDILDRNKCDESVLDYTNWDFGLFNYDVR